VKKIGFNVPYAVGPELSYIQQAIQNAHLSGDGEFTKKCHQFLQSSLGVSKALLTTSCTHALEMSALLLEIQPGDEVIVPAFTFVSSINAFVLFGAKPVFADIRPDTLNIDETRLEALITDRTRAIVCVHYAGVGCEMDALTAIARKYGLALIEDNAHGLFGKYKGQYLGTFGDSATQSFHETKNFQCGEGGALLINRPEWIERAEIIREKGTNRSRFFRGQVDKYTWVDVGSSYLPSDMLAGFLYAQFEARDHIQSLRQNVWQYYCDNLQGWARENGVRLPVVPNHCEQTYHMFYMLLPSLHQRQAFIKYLADHNIQSVFHYLPLNISDMGRKYGGYPEQCPVTEAASDELVRLPFYNALTRDDQDYIIEVIHGFSLG
jgi:dTDP-4-amino-4,6-dideoxygalactose transaminase